MMLPRHRRSVRDTLRMIFGKRGRLVEAADVAKVFANFASCLTEAFIAGSDRGDRLRGAVVNDHHYVQAFEHGCGVIAATAHTGGWQAAGSLMQSMHDEDTLVVMQRERDERAQALSDAVRDRAGVRVAHIGDSPFDALPLLAHLRRRGVVAVQIDRLPAGMRGREVRMFGQPWLVPEGPFLLAALSGAPIVPVFTRRLRYMEYEVFIAPPIRLPRKPSQVELDAAAQQAITEMERYVRAHPTQWFHFDSDSPKSAVAASGTRRSPLSRPLNSPKSAVAASELAEVRCRGFEARRTSRRSSRRR
ncbi:MAG: lysophospholipid acyltransferase family protein [Polyangiaceae bacterium]